MPHLVATLIYLSQIYSHYIRGDRSPLMYRICCLSMKAIRSLAVTFYLFHLIIDCVAHGNMSLISMISLPFQLINILFAA